MIDDKILRAVAEKVKWPKHKCKCSYTSRKCYICELAIKLGDCHLYQVPEAGNCHFYGDIIYDDVEGIAASCKTWMVENGVAYECGFSPDRFDAVIINDNAYEADANTEHEAVILAFHKAFCGGDV